MALELPDWAKQYELETEEVPNVEEVAQKEEMLQPQAVQLPDWAAQYEIKQEIPEKPVVETQQAITATPLESIDWSIKGDLSQKAASVDALAQQSGLPAGFLPKVLGVESGWNPSARSTTGAKGIGQFIDSTWKQYGTGVPEDVYNPVHAIPASIKYFKDIEAALKKKGLPTTPEMLYGWYNQGGDIVNIYKAAQGTGKLSANSYKKDKMRGGGRTPYRLAYNTPGKYRQQVINALNKGDDQTAAQLYLKAYKEKYQSTGEETVFQVEEQDVLKPSVSNIKELPERPYEFGKVSGPIVETVKSSGRGVVQLAEGVARRFSESPWKVPGEVDNSPIVSALSNLTKEGILAPTDFERAETGLGRFTQDLTSSLGPTMTGMALSLANPTAGAAYWTATGAGDFSNQLRESGMDTDKALAWGLPFGVAQMLLERAGMEGVIGKNIKKELIKRGGKDVSEAILKRIGNAMFAEGSTEAIQGLNENITRIIALGKDQGKSTQEIAEEVIDRMPEILKDSAYQGLIGAASGGLIGGPTAAIQTIQDVAQIRADQEAVDQPKLAEPTPQTPLTEIDQARFDEIDQQIILNYVNDNDLSGAEKALNEGEIDNDVYRAVEQLLTPEPTQTTQEDLSTQEPQPTAPVEPVKVPETTTVRDERVEGEKQALIDDTKEQIENLTELVKDEDFSSDPRAEEITAKLSEKMDELAFLESDKANSFIKKNQLREKSKIKPVTIKEYQESIVKAEEAKLKAKKEVDDKFGPEPVRPEAEIDLIEQAKPGHVIATTTKKGDTVLNKRILLKEGADSGPTVNAVKNTLREVFPVTENLRFHVERMPNLVGGEVIFQENGTADVYIDNSLTDSDAISTVLHEAIGHYGVEQLMKQSPDMQVKLDEMYDSFPDTDIKQQIDEIYPDADPTVKRQEYFAEVFAQVLRGGINKDGSKNNKFFDQDIKTNDGVFTKIYKTVKQWLHKILSKFKNTDKVKREEIIKETWKELRKLSAFPRRFRKDEAGTKLQSRKKKEKKPDVNKLSKADKEVKTKPDKLSKADKEVSDKPKKHSITSLRSEKTVQGIKKKLRDNVFADRFKLAKEGFWWNGKREFDPDILNKVIDNLDEGWEDNYIDIVKSIRGDVYSVGKNKFGYPNVEAALKDYKTQRRQLKRNRTKGLLNESDADFLKTVDAVTIADINSEQYVGKNADKLIDLANQMAYKNFEVAQRPKAAKNKFDANVVRAAEQAKKAASQNIDFNAETAGKMSEVFKLDKSYKVLDNGEEYFYNPVDNKWSVKKNGKLMKISQANKSGRDLVFRLNQRLQAANPNIKKSTNLLKAYEEKTTSIPTLLSNAGIQEGDMIYDVFYKDITTGDINTNQANFDWHDELTNIVAPIKDNLDQYTPARDVGTIAKWKGKGKVKTDQFKANDGSTVIQLTPAEQATLYVTTKNSDVYEDIKENGLQTRDSKGVYSQRYMVDVDDIVSQFEKNYPDLVKASDKIFNYLNRDEFVKALTDTGKQVGESGIGIIEDYFPTSRGVFETQDKDSVGPFDGISSEQDNTMNFAEMAVASVRTSNLKARKQNKRPYVMQDIFKLSDRYMKGANRYINMYQPFKTADRVLSESSNDLKKGGLDVLANVMRAKINEIGGLNRRDDSAFTKALRKIMSNYALAKLSGNLSVILKQLPSAFSVMRELSELGLTGSEIGQAALSTTKLENPLKPGAETAKIDRVTPLRMRNGIMPDSGDLFSSQSQELASALGKQAGPINTLMTSTVGGADRAVMRMLYSGLSIAAENQGLVDGSQEWLDFMNWHAADIIQRTQPDHSVIARSTLRDEKNALGRSLFMFFSQREKLANMFKKDFNSLIKSIKKKDMKGVTSALKGLAITQGSTALNIAAINLLMGNARKADEPDEKAIWAAQEALKTFLGSFAGVNFLSDAAISSVRNEKWFKPGTIVESIMEDASKDVSAFTSGDWEDKGYALLNASGYLVGAPETAIKKTVKAIGGEK